MSAKEQLNQIVYQSKLNSSLLFLIKDEKGGVQYIPLEGIGDCVNNLKKDYQERFIQHCKSLVKDQDALLAFLRRLAKVVASRKL